MFKLLVIGLGGFVGAIARYGLSGLVHRYVGASFPTGTLVVNVLGCFVIGGLMYLVEDRQLFAPETRLFLQIGFIGSFTTLSTVGYETFALLRAGQIALASLNAAANVLLGIGAVALGWVGIKAIGI